MKSLQIEVMLTLLFLCLIYGAANYAVQRFIIMPSFTELERDDAQRDINHVARAIDREIFHLTTFCHDWSAWDDTYQFAKYPSEAYIKSNLLPRHLCR